MNPQATVTQLEQFRQRVYHSFNQRADASMNLIDALSSNTTARSVVELSLSPCFQRSYHSVQRAIDAFFIASSQEAASAQRRQKAQALMGIIARELPQPARRPFWLFGHDATSVPRPFAATLPDRGFVYQPDPIGGNKPVTIGHQCSWLAWLPEKPEVTASPWVVPLSVRRITSQESETQVGAEQLTTLLDDPALPCHGALCVAVSDSRYSTPHYLSQVARHDNLVTIARLRSNRILHRQPPPAAPESPLGHPRWYGKPFSLKAAATWGEPDALIQTHHTSRRGHPYTVHLEAWHNLLMRGKRGQPMHQHPFTLVRVRLLDAQGRPAFRRPLWLVVVGPRRHELSLLEVHEAYRQRYDLEHFFRFGKQKLLLTSYQTPDVEHEESWWQLVQLAYVQLWLARFLAQAMPRPWERYLPQGRVGVASPTTTQRDFGRIIRQIGTPAVAPKARGKSPGRTQGTRLVPRPRHQVVKKTRKLTRAA